MTPSAWVVDSLRPESELRQVDDHIWSILPVDAAGQRYDGRAAAYDRVVGSSLYNRLVWGSSPKSYSAFADRALRSAEGPFLDAGCGSLVFTVAAYAASDRPVILLDQSLGMLQAGRQRLVRQLGRVPGEVVFLQADLRGLPFRDGAFSTVLSMGMLHLFEELEPVVRELGRVTEPGGTLFMTSLVSDRAVGRQYLGMLERAGEVASPRWESDLRSSIGCILDAPVDGFREGNMSFVEARVR